MVEGVTHDSGATRVARWRETLILVALGLLVLVLPVPRCSGGGGASDAPTDAGANISYESAVLAEVQTSIG